MNGEDYNFRNAIRTKCKLTNQFPTDTLNVLLELIMIVIKYLPDFLTSDDTVDMTNSSS